jgi:hypothetical protein
MIWAEEVVVCFVDIDGIIEKHCLTFLFIHIGKESCFANKLKLYYYS